METILNTGRKPYLDDSFAETQRSSAAIRPLVLSLIVAQRGVLQYDPAVLPSMDIVGPLKVKHQTPEICMNVFLIIDCYYSYKRICTLEKKY